MVLSPQNPGHTRIHFPLNLSQYLCWGQSEFRVHSIEKLYEFQFSSH